MNDMWISDPKVEEAMTRDFGQVDQSMPLEEVVEMMLKHNWEEVLVRDEPQKMLGLVTKEHLVGCLANGFPQDMPVKEITCLNLITTFPQENLAKARDVMRVHRIGRLPVIGDEGDLLGILTAKDVCNGFSTKLERQGEQLCAVMENIAEAIQVIDCDGIVSFWNQGAEKLFGIKGTDIVGRKLSEFMPDDLPLQSIKTSLPYRNVMGELKDGIQVVRHAVPVVTRSGFTIGAVCTTVDVSHMKALLDKLDEANNRVKNLEKLMTSKDTPEDLLFYTVDPKTQRVISQASRVGKTDATVLIQGQSGTGKELLANIICQNSKRSDKPFIEVNCSAIPETLFESEMFGYEAGAFTGGNRAGKPGKFEIANHGTIFLDEVGELPLDMQAKLLRVIQERRFYRVGGTAPVEVDVRLIAATNRDIPKLVSQGKFREDLFYRLNVVSLEIPSLEMRKCDIPGLIEKILGKLSRVYQCGVKRVDTAVMDLFVNYNWPGNVRQLQNILENIVILMEGDEINTQTLIDVGILDLLRGKKETSSPMIIQKAADTHDDNLDQIIEQREREVIISALHDCYHNKSSAAKMLGIPRSTLYYKMKALGIEDNHVSMD
jgi:PAS domain S-box